MDYKILQKMPPFNADKYLKRTLCVSFYKDSNELIKRAKYYSDSMQTSALSVKSKVFVDIVMAAECALKSLIFSLSKVGETPEEAYRIARNCGHNLKALLTEVKARARFRKTIIDNLSYETLIQANSLSVGQRYSITSFMMISQEEWKDRGLRRGKISSTLNDEFINNLYRVVKKLVTDSYRISQEYYGHYARINGGKLKEIENRHTQFLQAFPRDF